MTRIQHILDSINKLLGEYNPVVRIIEHYTTDKEDIEYLNVRINIPHADTIVVIRNTGRKITW